MASKQILVVTIDSDGNPQERTLSSPEELTQEFEQIGIDDCSTDLSLRGFPVVRGLIGPIPESKTIARYESSAIFEIHTKEWAAKKTKRRRRTKAAIEAERAAQAAAQAGPAGPAKLPIPAPNGMFSAPTENTVS